MLWSNHGEGGKCCIVINNGKNVEYNEWMKGCGGIIRVCEERLGEVSFLDELSL